MTGFIDKKIYPANIHQLEFNFKLQLISHYEAVMTFENPAFKEKARQCMPIEDLKTEARKRQKEVQNSASNSSPPDEQDFLLIELMRWFKEEFFEWVNRPNCEKCGAETTPIANGVPLPSERQFGAERVEIYKCNANCSNFETRFPRYNNVGKLLETRKGRCGEWAKCFALCCRTVDLDTRLVVDWTDHVWVEVYSLSQQRWVHADPCENVCDQPLLYESGWKKAITYAIAFSKDEVLDVTWRYTSNHAKVLAGRLECREAWLLSTINELNAGRQQAFPLVHKKFLLLRLASELVELMTEAKPDQQLPGRSSGSLDWRLKRGETTGDQNAHFTFVITAQEILDNCLHVKYSSSQDKYFRLSGNREEVTEKWNSRIYECRSIFRKVEYDWKMAYIAREEGKANGYLSWKFDCKNSKTKINHVQILFQTQTFEDGIVVWSIFDDKNCLKFSSGETSYTGNDFKDSTCLTLSAELSRGKGGNAWQHAQLFRQSLKNKEEYPFEVLITFS